MNWLGFWGQKVKGQGHVIAEEAYMYITQRRCPVQFSSYVKEYPTQ